jgi:delta8-fatty-acid desaturase
VGPWNNFTPPIRGGVYRKAGDEASVSVGSSDDESSDGSTVSTLSSLASSISSLDIPEHLDYSIRARRKSCSSNKSNEDEKDEAFLLFEDAWNSPPILSSKQHTSAESFTAQAVQDEIDDDVRDYPSLDVETQRNIILKYQALHQRVQDEGFYECRYLEYGKEFVRYTILFVVFLVCLRYGWYTTSAAFLGLFWVGHQCF